MADVYEQNLASKSTLTITDYIRVVGSDNVSYKQLVSDVAKKIIENYAGSTLAGSAQSVKSAVDSLNSKTEGTVSSAHTIDSTTTWLRKVNGVVTFALNVTTTSAVGTFGSIATLPDGFKPYKQLVFTAGNYTIDITSGGGAVRVSEGCPSGTRIVFTVSFITA